MGFPYKIRISGDIGDNLVFIGKVIGEAATVFGKYYAIQSHSCGEENRGEANCTDVIISEDIIYSPSFNHPNIMLCLTQTACCEFVDRLSQDGILIFDSEKVVDCPEKHSKEYHYPIFQTARDTFGNESSACIIAIGILAELVESKGGKIIGKVSTDGYEYDDSDLNIEEDAMLQALAELDLVPEDKKKQKNQLKE